MRKRCKILIVAIISAATSISIAWAAGDGTTSWQEAETIYKLIRGISIPLSVVGMAFCGVKMLTGGDEAARRAKKTMLIIGGALAALLLLPLAVKAGADIGSQNKWDPRHPAHCYVETINWDLPKIETVGRERSE